MTNFSAAREMAPYLAQPPAMPVGSPGKVGYLFLGFELDPDGKSIMRDWERRVPLIVQQELYFDEAMPEMPCVYILSSGGPNVDGDRYEQHFVVRDNAYAHLSTGAATKLAEMRHNFSGLTQTFSLGRDAYLEFLPEPTIPCRHTRFICDTCIRIDPTATLFYAEIYMSGRKYFDCGERFRYDILSVSTHAERPDGEELFREKFIIRPGQVTPDTLGAMNGYDVFANVIVLTPAQHAERIYAATEAFINPEQRLAAGITRLPNGCGLLYKVLGEETEPVKRLVRRFCSSVRLAVKQRPLPDEFPWR
ncbi:urease accessory protein UreD [Alistipes sp.]|uniref:urease accessory protein UreD n=1 Tax=Alistipes sp. TaxID=1872444 RepID=UPI003AF1D2A8